MEAFLISTGLVSIAEIGDKTMLLSIVMAATWRRPTPIILGILAATLLNHAFAALAGTVLAHFITGEWMRWIVGLAFLGFAAWALIPDTLDEQKGEVQRGFWAIFWTTASAFFLIEMGDKTQVATAMLAARFENLPVVVAGSTLGMMLVNGPAVLLGETAAKKRESQPGLPACCEEAAAEMDPVRRRGRFRRDGPVDSADALEPDRLKRDRFAIPLKPLGMLQRKTVKARCCNSMMVLASRMRPSAIMARASSTVGSSTSMSSPSSGWPPPSPIRMDRIIFGDEEVQDFGDGAGAHEGLEDLADRAEAIAQLLLDLGADSHLGLGVVQQTGRRLDQQVVIAVQIGRQAELAHQQHGARRRIIGQKHRPIAPVVMLPLLGLPDAVAPFPVETGRLQHIPVVREKPGLMDPDAVLYGHSASPATQPSPGARRAWLEHAGGAHSA